MSEVVLETRNLVKHFPLTRGIVLKRKYGAVQAVDGVNLTLARGETLGVVGESGCGKSTLAKLLVGLEKPTSGSIVVRGQDMSKMDGGAVRRARRNIQLVMQDPYTSLNPRMTVADIIGEPFDIHPEVAPKGSRGDKVRDLIDLVGLNPDHINRYPHQFSGGQRQRIGIARALALSPEIIICDEPVSALDVSIQAQVVNLLEKLQNELKLSYIFIAHDLSVVRHIADRVAVMYLGKVVEFGSDVEIYDKPTHPYTQALLSAVPVPDPTLRGLRDQIVLEGDVPSPANPPSGCRFRTRCWKVSEICATDEPSLAVRERSAHHSACHFAEVRDVVHATADEAGSLPAAGPAVRSAAVLSLPVQASAPAQESIAAPVVPKAVPLGAPAGLGLRLAARVVDGLVMAAPYLFILCLGLQGGPNSGAIFNGIYIAVVSTWVAYVFLYEFVMLGRRGQTVGKRVMGLTVVKQGGGKISWGDAAKRVFVQQFVSILTLGLGGILFGISPVFDRSPYRRGWADKVAGTVVVRA